MAMREGHFTEEEIRAYKERRANNPSPVEYAVDQWKTPESATRKLIGSGVLLGTPIIGKEEPGSAFEQQGYGYHPMSTPTVTQRSALASPMKSHSSPGVTSNGEIVYQPTQYDKSRSVPRAADQAAANASAAGNNASKQGFGYITIGGKKYPLKGEPSGINRVNMDDGGVMVWGHTGGDDTRNFQYAIGHGPLRERRTQAQPRGLHYVPGGWANDGYSFEGSAEDRARFFAPVSRPYNHAPRSDNDTFLALQRQKAMQPVEQPLPERPEFPADRRMGWHTKLAKYQADMDAYNRQMANIAGYRQAMDVAALQQMPKPTDPVEQARLERALALQERQAAQQAAYQQAQLDQRDREMVQNYLNSMPERQVQAARLGYQAMTNQAVSDLLDAYKSGDQARIARAGAVWNALNNTSEKKGDADKWEVREFEGENGDKVPVRVNLNTGEVNRINIDGLDARVKEAKQALLKDVGRYDQNNPEVKKLVAALESARTLEEVRAVQERMKSIGK